MSKFGGWPFLVDRISDMPTRLADALLANLKDDETILRMLQVEAEEAGSWGSVFWARASSIQVLVVTDRRVLLLRDTRLPQRQPHCFAMSFQEVDAWSLGQNLLAGDFELLAKQAQKAQFRIVFNTVGISDVLTVIHEIERRSISVGDPSTGRKSDMRARYPSLSHKFAHYVSVTLWPDETVIELEFQPGDAVERGFWSKSIPSAAIVRTDKRWIVMHDPLPFKGPSYGIRTLSIPLKSLDLMDFQRNSYGGRLAILRMPDVLDLPLRGIHADNLDRMLRKEQSIEI